MLRELRFALCAASLSGCVTYNTVRQFKRQKGEIVKVEVEKQNDKTVTFDVIFDNRTRPGVDEFLVTIDTTSLYSIPKQAVASWPLKKIRYPYTTEGAQDGCTSVTKRPVSAANACTKQKTELIIGPYSYQTTSHAVLLPIVTPLAVVADIVLSPFELAGYFILRKAHF